MSTPEEIIKLGVMYELGKYADLSASDREAAANATASRIVQVLHEQGYQIIERFPDE